MAALLLPAAAFKNAIQTAKLRGENDDLIYFFEIQPIFKFNDELNAYGSPSAISGYKSGAGPKI
tara:strand:- start:20 stop:211 length:192 start_codon:yes stop_codon:yes gene_type:complete